MDDLSPLIPSDLLSKSLVSRYDSNLRPLTAFAKDIFESIFGDHAEGGGAGLGGGVSFLRIQPILSSFNQWKSRLVDLPSLNGRIELIHLPLLGYFVLILILLLAILPNLVTLPTPPPAPVASPSTARLVTSTTSPQQDATSSGLGPRPSFLFRLQTKLWISIALLSLTFTWTYMALYFRWSFLDAALKAHQTHQTYNTQAWLSSTSLFKQAWEIVCRGVWQWSWSEQLCAWTVGHFTVFLEAESKRYNFKRPAILYMILGQVVAISFAQSLFLLTLTLHSSSKASNPSPAALSSTSSSSSSSSSHPSNPSQRDNRRFASRSLIFCTLVALTTVAITPGFLTTTTTTTPSAKGEQSSDKFLWNLLIMHGLSLVPLFLHWLKSRNGTEEKEQVQKKSNDSKDDLITKKSVHHNIEKNDHHGERSISYEKIYLYLTMITFCHRLKTISNLFLIPSSALKIENLGQTFFTLTREYLSQMWLCLIGHPAQSSIGWDIIWSWSFWIWIIFDFYQYHHQLFFNDQEKEKQKEKERVGVVVRADTYSKDAQVIATGTKALPEQEEEKVEQREELPEVVKATSHLNQRIQISATSLLILVGVVLTPILGMGVTVGPYLMWRERRKYNG